METHSSPPLTDLNLLSRNGLSFLLFLPLPIPHFSLTSEIFPVLASKSQFGVLNDQFYEWQVWPNGLASQKGCHIEPLGIRVARETPHFRSMPVEATALSLEDIVPRTWSPLREQCRVAC